MLLQKSLYYNYFIIILVFISILIGTTFILFQCISVVLIYAMLHIKDAEKINTWEFILKNICWQLQIGL